MASLKIKFRASSANGKRGILYYQIIHKRVVRQIPTKYKILEKEWDKSTDTIIIDSKSARYNLLMEIRNGLNTDIRRLRSVMVSLDSQGIDYSTDDIVTDYFNKLGKLSFLDALVQNINQLKLLGKIRTSETYTAALKSFRQFLGNKDMYFDVMDSGTMLQYEAYLKNKQLSMNTISFYMRILRAVYNRGIEEGITDNKNPFKHVYTGIDKTIKRAITAKEIKIIKDLNFTADKPLDLARDLFLFSFYTRGMSFVDMSFLKKENLNNGVLSYRRKKTGQQLFIKWEKCMQDIVSKYESDCGEDYLLPIITDSQINPRRQYLNALSYTNKKLKRIAQLSGLQITLTMYVARHSWASIAKQNRIPISIISEGMGHDSESTTQIYLASLDSSAVDRANHIILKLI